MEDNILSKIKQLSEDLPKTSEKFQYTDKPLFNDLKRVLRTAKKVSNKEKPRKIGYFIKEAKKSSGSDKNKEEIIRSIFGDSQQMSTAKFIEKIYDYANETFPKGEVASVNPETAFQTTQRIVSNKEINRTLSVSLFGSILEKPLKKFMKEHPEFNEAYRNIHRNISHDHFNDSAAFVRYTIMSDDWIHFDAFQTDYFNKIRKSLHGVKNEKVVENFMKELESKEFEFFKTAVSYVIRVNPNVKVFTASTPDIVKRVENMKSGTLKLINLYHKLPKALGFKLITIDKLFQIFDTRPGDKSKAKKKMLNKIISNKSKKVPILLVKKTLANIKKDLISNLKTSKNISNSELDALIRRSAENATGSSQEEEKQKIIDGFHQLLGEISKAYTDGNEGIKSLFKDERFIKLVDSKVNKTAKGEDLSTEIWWANKGTIFEDTDRDKILRMIT